MVDIVFNTGVDMTNTEVTQFASGGVVEHNSREVIFQDNSGFGELDVHGRFGDFDGNGLPHSGTITGFEVFFFGSEEASFSHMRLDVATFDNYLADNDSQGLVEFVLSHNDDITGSTQDDILIGLRGRDAINGNDGNDVLVGGVDGDTLTGGLGDDVFHYDKVGDSGKRGVDTITDLGNGNDQIDLHDIDADIHTAGNQDFHIVKKFDGNAGEITLRYDAAHERTIISLDVTGDGQADGIIWVAGDHHDFTNFVF